MRAVLEASDSRSPRRDGVDGVNIDALESGGFDMYIFNRTRIARPERFSDAVVWSIDIAGKASSASGLPIEVWTSVMGVGAGTIAWTTSVESLAEFEVATDKLAGDAAYNEAGNSGHDLFTGGVDDGMLNVLSEVAADGPELTHVAVVSATAAVGQLAAAMQHGLAIASAANATSELTTWFGAEVTGAYGGVRWLTGAPSIAALEASMIAVNSDPAFVALVDAGGTNFVPGAIQTIYRRLA